VAAANPIGLPANGNACSGSKKVALLLLAMGRPLAAQVLKHFNAVQLREIRQFGSDLDRVSATDIEALIEEFGREFANGVKFLGTAREIEDLISGALTPEQIAQMQSQSAPDDKEPAWERLSTLNERTVAAFIAPEHPQIGAAVLARISSDLAARVLAVLSSEQRRRIMGRMLSTEPVSGSALEVLGRTLAAHLLAQPVGASGSDSRAHLANIMNKLDQAQIEEALGNLAEVRPDEAKALKRMLFTFADLARLTPAARTILLDKVATDRLVTALRGADAGLQDLALASLSARARRMAEAELKSGQVVAQREISAAQRTISDLALAMAARGEIELEPPEDHAMDQA
jgi:flagellar motor switch protein FliG